MACFNMSELPYLLVGEDANGNMGTHALVLNYLSPLTCDYSLGDWKNHVIEIDVNGKPNIRMVFVARQDLSCANLGNYQIDFCGLKLFLVMADDNKPALLFLT